MLYPKTILLSIILFATTQLKAQASKEEFIIVRQDEKITLYERWAYFPGSTIRARQIKSVFQSTATLDKMFAAITNPAKVIEWQKNIVEHRYVSKTDSSWHTYSLYDIPWPLTNQDYLLQYTITEKTGTRMIISFIYSLNETLAPVRKDVDRMPTIGEWVLEKTSNNQIKVTYTVTSIPVSFPRFITDTIVRNNFMHILHKLIAVAEK